MMSLLNQLLGVLKITNEGVLDGRAGREREMLTSWTFKPHPLTHTHRIIACKKINRLALMKHFHVASCTEVTRGGSGPGPAEPQAPAIPSPPEQTSSLSGGAVASHWTPTAVCPLSPRDACCALHSSSPADGPKATNTYDMRISKHTNIYSYSKAGKGLVYVR